MPLQGEALNLTITSESYARISASLGLTYVGKMVLDRTPDWGTLTISTVPEPAAAIQLGLGLAGLACVATKRRRSTRRGLLAVLALALTPLAGHAQAATTAGEWLDLPISGSAHISLSKNFVTALNATATRFRTTSRRSMPCDASALTNETLTYTPNRRPHEFTFASDSEAPARGADGRPCSRSRRGRCH